MSDQSRAFLLKRTFLMLVDCRQVMTDEGALCAFCEATLDYNARDNGHDPWCKLRDVFEEFVVAIGIPELKCWLIQDREETDPALANARGMADLMEFLRFTSDELHGDLKQEMDRVRLEKLGNPPSVTVIDREEVS